MERILMDASFIIGIFFVFAGVVGINRMPDTFCRLQSSTNITTMGAIFILLGCAIFGISAGDTGITVKAILIGLIIILTNPAASHIMAKSAYKSEAKMTKETVCDAYKEEV